MLSDRIISIAGHSLTITSHDIVLISVSIVTGLLFCAILYFSRKRVVVVRRSSGTDQVSFELSRIADALDRIANQNADKVIAAAVRREDTQTQPSSPASRSIAYSMFGR